MATEATRRWSGLWVFSPASYDLCPDVIQDAPDGDMVAVDGGDDLDDDDIVQRAC